MTNKDKELIYEAIKLVKHNIHILETCDLRSEREILANLEAKLRDAEDWDEDFDMVDADAE